MSWFGLFGPHIHKVNEDTWVIRKRTFIGYQYLDRNGDYWWITQKYIIKYCLIHDYAVAQRNLSLAKL